MAKPLYMRCYASFLWEVKRTEGPRDKAPHAVAEGEFGYRPPRAAEGAGHAGGDGGQLAPALHQRGSLLAAVIVQVAVSLGNVTNNVHVVGHKNRHQPGGVALLAQEIGCERSEVVAVARPVGQEGLGL